MVHSEELSRDKKGLVQTYVSSCWLRMLEPSPPLSESSKSSSCPSSSTESSEDDGQLAKVRPELSLAINRSSSLSHISVDEEAQDLDVEESEGDGGDDSSIFDQHEDPSVSSRSLLSSSAMEPEEFYIKFVRINDEAAKNIEESTRQQSSSAL